MSNLECPAPSVFARRSRGFSFTELLFAVMILGIGFILIAAIFPVGLAQTKSNFDETHAASLARAATAEIGKSAKAADFASTALIPLQTFGNNATDTSKLAHSNMISPSDPRYAWVAFCRRLSMTGKAAQVCVFVVNRAQPFAAADLNDLNGAGPLTRSLEPRAVKIKVTADRIWIKNKSPAGSQTGASSRNWDAAAPGAFVLVQNDDLPTNYTDSFAGRVYRLGSLIAQGIGDTDHGDYKVFEYFPGNAFEAENVDPPDPDDMGPSIDPPAILVTELGDNGTGFIIGRNRIGDDTSADFDGGVMDVAYYTTLISLK